MKSLFQLKVYKKKELQKIKKAMKKASKEEAAELFAIILFNVKLNFTNLTPKEQIGKARDIVTKMTGNAFFPDPNPTLADVTTAIDALAVADQAMDRSRAKTIVRNARRLELEQIMQKLQYYVQYTSGGNPEIIITSGMDVNDMKNPLGFLPAPANVRAVNGGLVGTVDLRWDAVAKKTGYRIEVSMNPSEGWPIVMEAAKASATITDLTPGVTYYFRIATLSRAGYNTFSAFCLIRVNLPTV
ncbi:MAG: fibronectin type III domain-containing protein [Bacteroidetes bacterium]|nr:fibronectin type III domain-containing protein [Bacteroidota bacterium]